MSISEAKALSTFSSENPDDLMKAALQSVESILSLPLFLLEEQKLVKKTITVRRLLLMGELPDPVPDEITLNSPLEHDRAIYLGVRGGAICLSPFLAWGLVPSKANYGIQFIHALKDKHVKYVTIYSDEDERNGNLLAQVQTYLQGKTVALEAVSQGDGKEFVTEWAARRQAAETSWMQSSGQVPWQDFDKDSILWFGRRLGSSGTTF